MERHALFWITLTRKKNITKQNIKQFRVEGIAEPPESDHPVGEVVEYRNRTTGQGSLPRGGLVYGR